MGLNLDQVVFFDNNKSSQTKNYFLLNIVKFLNNYDKSKDFILVDNNKKLWDQNTKVLMYITQIN